MENINVILENFKFKGDLIDCSVYGSGHINVTYLAVYNNNGKEENILFRKLILMFLKILKSLWIISLL